MKRNKGILMTLTLSMALTIGVAFASWQTGEGGGPNSVVGSFNGSSVEPVARIDQTYYSSIEKAIDDGVLELCYPSTYLYEYDGTAASITQDNTSAWVDPNVLTISYVGSDSSYTPSSSTYTTGLPTNAGYYVIKIAASNGYSTSHTINCRISPKVLYIKETCSYSLDYDSSSRTSTTLFNAVTNIQFTDNQTTQSTYTFTSYAIVGMDNGMYYYPNSAISSSQPTLYANYVNACNSAGLLTSPQSGVTNIVGSTYAVTVASTDSNYEIANRCILKYKTALVDSTYYTIEDALSLSGTTIVTFAGDSTNNTSYVATCFCALTDENPYSSTLEYTMSKNMVINYQSGTETSFGTNSEAATGGYVYSSLIIPSNVTLNVSSSYSLTINAVLGYKQPQASATLARGVLLNEGTIIVYGNLYSYGYLKGTGIVIFESSSKAYDVLRHFDWCGGNTATKCNSNNCMPLNAWSLHNMSCTTKFKYGSKLYAQYYGYSSASPTPLILSNSTSDNCVFVIKDSSSFILKKASTAANNTSDTGLTLINGSNQTMGQKDIIELYGNFVDSTLSMTVYVTISTSTSMACPLGYMDVTLKNSDSDGNSYSTTLSISKSDFRFMPGTKMIIESGTTLTTSSGADLIFETWNHVNQTVGVDSSGSNFYYKCVDQTDAYMVVNGTCNANGSIAGKITTTTSGAKLVTGSSFGTMTFYVLYHAIGASSSGSVAYQVSSMYGYGYINQSSTLYNFAASKTYTSVGSYFSGTAGSASSEGTFNADGLTVSASCITGNTLVTLADGTQTKASNLKVGDLLKTWSFEKGDWVIEPIIFLEKQEDVEISVIILTLEDNNYIEISWKQGFFDTDLLDYFVVSESNYQDVVGRNILAFDGDMPVKKRIVSASIETKITSTYEIHTGHGYQFIANDILTIEPLINEHVWFTVNDDYKYDEELMKQDIERYGVLPYEVFADYVTEEQYDLFNGQYLAVPIGKGYFTFEELMEIIKRFLPGNS